MIAHAEQTTPSHASKKVVYVAIVANLAIAVFKYVAAAITGSPAMLAEAFHSTADTGNEFLMLLGMTSAMGRFCISIHFWLLFTFSGLAAVLPSIKEFRIWGIQSPPHTWAGTTLCSFSGPHSISIPGEFRTVNCYREKIPTRACGTRLLAARIRACSRCFWKTQPACWAPL